MNTAARTYFPNLDALRFIAASMVVLSHTEQIKGFHGYKCYRFVYPTLFQGGHLAVIFFFALSGFLITHIIKNNLNDNNFSVSNFYKKRVVRIWPLYYLIVLVGLFVIPNISFMHHNVQWVDTLTDLTAEEYTWTTLLYLLVLPNISLFFGVFEYLGHTWSIGVEEQFYLIWPLLMKWFKSQILRLLISVLIVIWSVRLFSGILDLQILQAFMNIFKIDAMAMGGIAAIVVLEYPKYRAYLVNRWTELIAMTIAGMFYFTQTHFGIISDEVYSLLFAIIIVNAATNPKTILRLESIKPLGYLGKVSYGIYMYHPITGMLAIILFRSFHNSYLASLTSNLVFYGVVFFIASSVAIISYEFFEKPIMNAGRKKWLTTNHQE